MKDRITTNLHDPYRLGCLCVTVIIIQKVALMRIVANL